MAILRYGTLLPVVSGTFAKQTSSKLNTTGPHDEARSSIMSKTRELEPRELQGNVLPHGSRQDNGEMGYVVLLI